MLLLSLLLLLLPVVSSYKILIYNSKFAHSHSKYMGAIADTLMEAGHKVISLMPTIDPSVPDYTKTKVIRYERNDDVAKHLSNFHDINFFTIPVDEYTLPWTMGPPTAGLFSAMCNQMLNEPGLIEMLKTEKFDVMLREGDSCGTGISHLIEVPAFVQCSSNVMVATIAKAIGIPLPKSYVPSFSTVHINPHSMWSRAKNWINHIVMDMYHSMPTDDIELLFKEKYGPDFPSLTDIVAKSALVLTNQEPVIDIAYPTLKKVIDLGGIVASNTKPLDEHWLSILSLRSRSVIFSFGSIARSTVMPIDAKRGIIKAMSSFPDITFIWKYETPEDDFAVNEASKVKNIVLTKWMPQNDLLNDKRVVAFVSHAGGGSVMEVAKAAVPTIFVPLFAEQPRNAAAVARTGMALVYDKHELSNAEKLTESLFRKAASLVSLRLAKRPFSPKELLMLPTRDRAKMREKARRATEDEKNNVLLTWDGRLIHDGTGMMNDFDELPNESEKMEEVYRQFKIPCRTHSERGAAIDILDDLINRKGKEIIRAFVNENKLKPFCTNLLRDVRDESNNGVKNKLCRFIGSVAAKRNDSWPDLHRFIRTSLSSNKSHKQTALQLIGNSESPVYEWATVKDLIVENLLCSDSTLREPAMKALGKFAKVVNDNHEMMEIMERMTPILLERAEADCSLVDCDYEHISAFICLYELACDAPKILKDHVEKLLAMSTKIIIDQIICEKRDNRLLALQMMTCMSVKYGPSVPVHLIPQIATSCLFAIANTLGNWKTDQWLLFDPVKDDVNKGEDWALNTYLIALCQFGDLLCGPYVYVEKIATAIGKRRMGSHLVAITQQFLQDEHWEKRAAALIGWASVGDSFRRGRVLTIVDWAIAAFNDSHPRVRYASYYLLGRVFCSFNINDHPKRLEKVFSSLISTLSDPIPRIVTIGAADLSDLMRHCSKDYLSPYYDDLLPLLISIISRCPEGGNMNLPCSAFESISYLAVAVGKDRFIHDFPKVVSAIGPYLKSLVFVDSSNQTPVLLSRTILLSSERICLLLGTDSIPLLNLFDKKKDGLRVLAGLFNAINTEYLDDSIPIVEKVRLIPFSKQLCSFAGEHEILTKEEIESTMRNLKKFLIAMVPRILVVLISTCCHHVIGASEESFLLNNHKLLGTLMEGYDSGLSPYNTHSTRFNGSLVDNPAAAAIISQLNFVRLIRVEEREQQIYTVLVIVTKWRDPRLRWDPAEFGGIDHIYVQADLIWHPEVAACDSSAYTPVLPDHAVFVKVNHTGDVVADRAYAVTYICEFDIAYFPFDKQSCDFCFFLPIYKQSELMLVGTFSDDLMVFDTPEWQLGDFSVEVQYKDKYELLTYNISMTRRAEFWVKMIIAPSFLIGCLILVGLLISVGEEAKSNAVNLGLTTMMSMTVILGILSDSIPKSKDLPVMGYFVLYEIVIIELAVVSVIYSKRVSRNMHRITQSFGVFQRPKIVEEEDMNVMDGEKRTVSSSIRRALRKIFDWLLSACSVRAFFFAFYLILHFLNAIYLLSHYQGCWMCIF